MDRAVPFGASLSGSDSPSKSIYLKPSNVKASIGSVTFSRLATRSLCCAEARMAASDSSYLDSAAAEIIVVRHGETEWNADGRIQGHLDVELNDVGRQQAAAVADRLSKENKISVVYSSDLKRRDSAVNCYQMWSYGVSPQRGVSLLTLRLLKTPTYGKDIWEIFRAKYYMKQQETILRLTRLFYLVILIKLSQEGEKVLINSTSVARLVWRISAESTKDSKLLLSLMEVLSDTEGLRTSEFVEGLWARY